MDRVSQEAVDAMLPLVSAQRREEALRYKHLFGQFCCLKSYCMLQELLGSVYPLLGYEPLIFERNEYGKPSLKGHPEIFFSISHTKNAILVAISNRPIGVDVEAFRHPSDGLIERTMNAEEAALIASSPSASSSYPNPDAAFTALWTKKEAVLKLRGTGIVDELHNVLTPLDADLHMTTMVCPEKSYAMSIVEKKTFFLLK